MSDVNISKYRAQVIRQGSTPASPGFAVAEGQNPVDPSGSGQTHLPVTIATASTGLSITESQILSGAGLVSQYIRGDGSLADFPATTGGGSSVSYYLNGSVSQGTIGGVAYKQLNRTPVFGAGTDFTIAADGYIASFITDASDPNKLLIPAGNWNFETYFSASSNGGSPSFYVELYKYDGTTFTLIATSSSAPELIAFGTSLNPYYSTLAVPETALALTDRLAIRYYVTHSGRTITLHTEDNHLCQIITTFTTGLTALNGLTAQVQNFAVGTSGTDFAIASATATHTFNLPTASATNRGALSSADWTTFNNKTSNLGTVTSVGLSSATSGVTIGSTPVTTSGTITLAIATASGSLNGLLSSTDWTTFNNKASTAALAAYLPLTGGTLTGALNGTSATFGGLITGQTTSNATITQNFLAYNSGTSISGASYDFASGGTAQTARISANYEASSPDRMAMRFLVGQGSGLVELLKLYNNTMTVTGAATFSSTLQTTHIGINNAPTLARLFATQTTDGEWVATFKNYGGSTSYGVSIDMSGSTSNQSAFQVYTSTGNGLRLVNNSRLLIGTFTDSGYQLDVNGTGRFSGSLRSTTGDIRSINTGSNSPGSGPFYLLGDTTGTNFFLNQLNASNGLDWYYYNGTYSSSLFKLTSTGAATFSSLGTGTVTATGGTLSTVSDSSFKTDDAFIDSALEKVLELKPRYFYWNEKSGLPTDIRQLGFYAQEVNEALGEEAANTPQNENTPWGISDRSMIAMLTKAIQELKQEIDTLKS